MKQIHYEVLMHPSSGVVTLLVSLAGLWLSGALAAAELFHIATYNLENYFDEPVGSRPAKGALAKDKIRQSLRAAHAEVVALQELGKPEGLVELQTALEAEGLRYRYRESVKAADTNIQLAVLSQFPIVARRDHTNESFLLFGRRYRVGRGFAEVDIEVNPQYRFTLLAAHLKSRIPTAEADQADLREQEALVLRGITNERLAADPDMNLVVLGDFNDSKDSKTIRSLIGRGRSALTDTRPAERNGDTGFIARPHTGPRTITWTYYYEKEDTFSRVDYILVSRGMAREWQANESYVLNLPDWGVASDHRPVVAGFVGEEK